MTEDDRAALLSEIGDQERETVAHAINELN
jgi:hypothetical protein